MEILITGLLVITILGIVYIAYALNRPRANGSEQIKALLEELRVFPEARGLSVKQAGFMTVEVNVAGVDKALALDYLMRHFDEILDFAGYTPGELIDARSTKTIISADNDGTTCAKPTEIKNPALYESIAVEALVRYLEAGGVYMIISGNDIELTKQRLLEKDAIPAHLRNRLIVVANGGATFCAVASNGELREFIDYHNNALADVQSGKERAQLDIMPPEKSKEEQK